MEKLGPQLSVYGTHTLINQTSQTLETAEQPAVALFNTFVWICYRGVDGRLKLGCRYPYVTPSNMNAYNYVEEIDLTGDISVRAQTSHAPAICTFNQRLYVFWVNPNGDREGQVIKYNRTDGTKGEGSWFTNGSRTAGSAASAPFKSSAMPAVTSFGGLLYLAWLDEVIDDESEEYFIYYSTSTDGMKWTPSVKVPISASDPATMTDPDNASSLYSPDFAVIDDALHVFWGPIGAGATTNAVMYKRIAGKTAKISTIAPEPVLQGKWKTQRGNMLTSRPGQLYLFSLDKNSNVWVATDDYNSRTPLGDQGVKSNYPPAACVLPGMPGSKWGTKWRIALFWKNNTNNNLSACSIDI